MPSIEALAMAGVDCVEFCISLEERERRDVEKTPQYLLADQGGEGEIRIHEKNKLMGSSVPLSVKESTMAQGNNPGTMDHRLGRETSVVSPSEHVDMKCK
ncbi:unnamed protein product [Dovyalis caffra]|uniref:Uncharacterized protein n=1 Tax=Dovyalis caffra TaxID=77055 RepID=A0AAV1RGQ4_9ROSI|nr:unnamed protein product [Dovyalis caffra]